MQGGRVCRLRGRAADERHPAPRDRAQEAETTGVVLQGADLRARETFPSTEIPERAGEGTSGIDNTTYAHAGQDLVPEPQVQDEEGGHREGGGQRERMLTEKSRCSVADQRRKALSVETDGTVRVSQRWPGPDATVHAETLLVVKLCERYRPRYRAI